MRIRPIRSGADYVYSGRVRWNPSSMSWPACQRRACAAQAALAVEALSGLPVIEKDGRHLGAFLSKPSKRCDQKKRRRDLRSLVPDARESFQQNDVGITLG